MALASPDASATETPPWPHEVTDVAPSPRVTWGRLENGLRYAILPNRTPAGVVSLRLLVNAGSIHENDDERGYAHFVEHMAFNGTRHFPAGELVKALQRTGAAFGPHVNATTDEQHTLYKLDLPENTSLVLEKGLLILRDFADGVLFSSNEVARERGVLTNERLTRLTVDHAALVDWRATILAGTRLSDRHPIGTPEGIKRADTAGLRAFYEAWYRPERMTVVIVGDIESSTLEPLVQASFGSLTARGAPRTEPDPGRPTLTEGTRAHFYPRRRDGLQVEIGVVRPPVAVADSEKRRRERLALELATRMLSGRLTRLRQSPEPPINNFRFEPGEPTDHVWVPRLQLVGATNRWETVLSTGEQALRRALDYGFEPSELAFVADGMRGALHAAAQAAHSLPTPALASSFLDNLEHGTVFTLPDERETTSLANLSTITPEDCRDALRAVWTGAPRYLYVSAYPKLLSLTPERILAADATSRAAAIAPPSAINTIEFAYRDFGPAGTVVEKRHVPELDLWQVRFANGVRLNVKTTRFKRGHVRVRINFGQGAFDEGPNQRGLASWVGALVQGGLRRHSPEELALALRGRTLQGSASNRDDTSQFDVQCTTADLSDALHLATAYLTDAAFRPEAAAPMRLVFADGYRTLNETPAGIVQRDVAPFLAGGVPWMTPAPLKTLQDYSLDQVAAWIEPILRECPLEVTIVGDTTLEDATTFVGKSLGALAPRRDPTTQKTLPPLAPPRPPQSKTFRYPSTVERPVTLVFAWPVTTALTPAERRHLRLVAEVLKDRLRIAVREEKGKTYTVNASVTNSEAYPDFADVRCQFDVEPKAARRVISQVRRLAAELAGQGVTTDELARAKAQAVAASRQQLLSNDYWLERLSRSQDRPTKLDELRRLESDYATATKPDLDRLAARFLPEKNLFDFRIEAVKAK